MATNQGIIFSDLLITNKEIFVDFFETYYLEKQQILDPIILNLNNVLTQYQTKQVTAAMSDSFKKAWKDFQKYVLLNTGDLQLLVAYRGYQGRDAQFSQIISQESVEGTVKGAYGINAGDDLIKDSMAFLKAKEVEQFLQLHLNGFLNQLEKKINKTEAYQLHRFHSYLLHNDFKVKDPPHITGTPWRVPFYGTSASHYFSGRGLGQAYDAFMNHLANHNKQVYNYLAQSGANNATILNTKEKASVYVEEGGVNKSGNFPRLLNESKNHTGWYTGGDIVIVNPETMSIVYNIQLKTTTANKPSVFAEKVSDIRNFIGKFIDLSPREKGEKLFDFFLTSASNKNDFNNKPQETIDALIADQLFKKTNIEIKLKI